jgi:NAD+ diphosphatase
MKKQVFSMFQDIAPAHYHVEFCRRDPVETDFMFVYGKGTALLEEKNGGLSLPSYQSVAGAFPEAVAALTYLFSVDETAVFLSLWEAPETEGFKRLQIFAFRDITPAWMAFAGATAFQLAGWYDAHRYCGCCGKPMSHKEDERAMVCPSCGLIDYPNISPVVIIAVTDGNKILLTKYANRHNMYALVAGFVEVGETLEDAVRREVMEEVGLKVKNLRYYKSQPWAFSSSLLSGFFCEVDGSGEVTLDQNELSEAVWFDREAIPPGGSTMSLTWTMVEAFRHGEM